MSVARSDLALALPPRRTATRRLSTLLYRRAGLFTLLLLTPPLLWFGVVYLGSLFALLIQSFFAFDDFTGQVVYQPKFTYIWELAAGRFPDELVRRVQRPHAVREIARCFLHGAGMTIPGELARVTGLSRPEAGLGNRALVAEDFAAMIAPGCYRLRERRD